MRGDGGRGSKLIVTPMGATIANELSDVIFPVPDSAAFGGFTIEFVMAVTSDVAVVVSKSVVFDETATVASFPVCDFFEGGVTIFGAEVRF